MHNSSSTSRSRLNRLILSILILSIPVIQGPAVFAADDDKDAAVAVEAEAESRGADFFPVSGLLTLGGRFSDDSAEGVGDLLVPLLMPTDNDLFYLNVRSSFSDASEEELNVGLGFRHLNPEQKLIFGANIFYDSRWTAMDSHFEQLGLGAEFMSELFDARFNYYIPDTDEDLVREFERTDVSVSRSTSTSTERSLGAIAPSGFGFARTISDTTRTRTTTRTTTTRMVFQQFEAALEGWDAEAGIVLPFFQALGETRVFLGYQDFDNPYGSDLTGAKGRIEIRLKPGIILDGEIFEEDELNGTDFFVGGRFVSGFDLNQLASGRNPFMGYKSINTPEYGNNFRNRLFENVIRDVKVQTALSGVQMNDSMTQQDIETQTRQTTTVEKQRQRLKHIRDGVEQSAEPFVFVDQTNGQKNPDGSARNPFPTFEEAIAAINGSAVWDSAYVFHTDKAYREHLPRTRQCTLLRRR